MAFRDEPIQPLLLCLTIALYAYAISIECFACGGIAHYTRVRSSEMSNSGDKRITFKCLFVSVSMMTMLR